MGSPVAPASAQGTSPAPLAEEDGQRSCRVYNTPGLVDYPSALQFQKDLQRERIDHKVAHKVSKLANRNVEFGRFLQPVLGLDFHPAHAAGETSLQLAGRSGLGRTP